MGVELARILLARLGIDAVEPHGAEELASELEAQQAEEALRGRTDIGATQKEQLVKARRGQGIFKANVRLNEKTCRVTGMTDRRLLVASHIKPWSKCNDAEKLDGCNGLLLSPHVDWLFDKGFISFQDNGDIIFSVGIDAGILMRWSISEGLNVGPFKREQSHYLDYHRSHVLKK